MNPNILKQLTDKALDEKNREAWMVSMLHNKAFDLPSVLQWLADFVAWKAVFAGCSASLSSEVLRSRSFVDPEPLHPDSDTLVSSEIAACIMRSSVGDYQVPPLRQQSAELLEASHRFYWRSSESDRYFRSGTRSLSPIEMVTKNCGTARGYVIFHRLGFHLASKLFPLLEFSTLDRNLRDKVPGLVAYLEKHDRYAWICEGSTSTAFEPALHAALNAMDHYAGPMDEEHRYYALCEGMKAYSDTQEKFFNY